MGGRGSEDGDSAISLLSLPIEIRSVIYHAILGSPDEAYTYPQATNIKQGYRLQAGWTCLRYAYLLSVCKQMTREVFSTLYSNTTVLRLHPVLANTVYWGEPERLMPSIILEKIVTLKLCYHDLRKTRLRPQFIPPGLLDDLPRLERVVVAQPWTGSCSDITLKRLTRIGTQIGVAGMEERFDPDTNIMYADPVLTWQKTWAAVLDYFQFDNLKKTRPHIYFEHHVYFAQKSEDNAINGNAPGGTFARPIDDVVSKRPSTAVLWDSR